MTVPGNKPQIRKRSVLFASEAALLSLLIAAAGPLSHTLRLVRVNPENANTGTATPQRGEFALEFSGAWIEAGLHPKPAPAGKPSGGKHVQLLQALSADFDTASHFRAPIADAPPALAIVIPPWVVTPVARTSALPPVAAPQELIPSGRGPPRA